MHTLRLLSIAESADVVSTAREACHMRNQRLAREAIERRCLPVDFQGYRMCLQHDRTTSSTGGHARDSALSLNGYATVPPRSLDAIQVPTYGTPIFVRVNCVENGECRGEPEHEKDCADYPHGQIEFESHWSTLLILFDTGEEKEWRKKATYEPSQMGKVIDRRIKSNHNAKDSRQRDTRHISELVRDRVPMQYQIAVHCAEQAIHGTRRTDTGSRRQEYARRHGRRKARQEVDWCDPVGTETLLHTPTKSI